MITVITHVWGNKQAQLSTISYVNSQHTCYYITQGIFFFNLPKVPFHWL